MIVLECDTRNRFFHHQRSAELDVDLIEISHLLSCKILMTLISGKILV